MGIKNAEAFRQLFGHSLYVTELWCMKEDDFLEWSNCEYRGNFLKTHNQYNAHEVACILAELFADECACNFTDINEWLPKYCDFRDSCCPNPYGVACWEQYLKYRDKNERGSEECIPI